MKHLFIILGIYLFAGNVVRANVPDSVYLYAFSSDRTHNKDGLQFAWSNDQKEWKLIGDHYGFVKSDYGRWDTEKRMIQPYLFRGKDGLWRCVWSLNNRENLFAYAASADLVHWQRQVYPFINSGQTFSSPVVKEEDGAYQIIYQVAANKYFQVTTKDFRSYSSPAEVTSALYKDERNNVLLETEQTSGTITKVGWQTVEGLIKTYQSKRYDNILTGETTSQDAERFKDLAPVKASFTPDVSRQKDISNMLTGVFFEDLNYAADGGLYAELIQNRDFEYRLSDKEGRDQTWNSTHSWKFTGSASGFGIDSASPLHVNNKHYAVLTTTSANKENASLINHGYDGIVLQKNAQYTFSFFSKSLKGRNGKLQVKLTSKGLVLASAIIKIDHQQWQKKTVLLTPVSDASDAQLELLPLAAGSMALDMISLMPKNTFKHRDNGLRNDLAETIAGIHPRFMRFPGGCVAHGDGLANIYQWKNTIGPLEARKPQRNLWGYHQSVGLGYFEYFQFCEDIGAAPVPVIAAAVPCQNSASVTGLGGGQQGGIPLDEMDQYINDIVDLVEYANGDVSTKWGKLRAEAGHPKPFGLKYIGIGNEDLISDIFEERFTMIFQALKKRCPEITVIGTAGPFCEGTDYEEGWAIMNKLGVSHVDEHYYQPPGWFINHQDFYDQYDRSHGKVYLGEYAAHLPGRPNNLETALAEALYLTAVERNGDVVSMASYAPLLAKEGHTQWNPDLIYFNNAEVKPTVGYYVQQLYGINAGDRYIESNAAIASNNDAVKKRIAVSFVKDSKTGDLVIKLVNLLPVTVQATINTNDTFAGKINAATRTVLTGNPADKNVKPVTASASVQEALAPVLPAYSFTVIRLQMRS